MLHAAGEELFALGFKPFPKFILSPDFDLGVANDFFADFWEAEAAFFFVEAALLLDDLGVDEDQLLFRLFAAGEVDDGDAFGHGDLRRGETDALRGVHGFEHVGDELAQLVVEFGDGFAGLLEDRFGVFDDGENHCPLIDYFLHSSGLLGPLRIEDHRRKK